MKFIRSDDDDLFYTKTQTKEEFHSDHRTTHLLFKGACSNRRANSNMRANAKNRLPHRMERSHRHQIYNELSMCL